MAVGTMLSRITGIGRQIALVSLGFGILTDTYNLANNSPNMIYELVVGGVLSGALLPLFVGLLRPGGTRRDRDGVSAIVTLSIVSVLIISAALWLGAPYVIRFLFSGSNDLTSIAASERAEAIRFGTSLLRLFAPQVAIYGCVTLSTALLQTKRRFGVSMFAPIINNVIMIIVFVWAKFLIDDIAAVDTVPTMALIRQHDRITRLLGLGTTAGVLAMLVVTIPALRSLRLGIRPIWAPRHPAVKELLTLTGWTIGYVAANQVALFFVLWTLGHGPEGDVTAYNSANSTFFQLPHGIIAVSIISALGPSLSTAFLNRSRRTFRAQLSRGIRTLLVLMTPAAAGIVVLARPLTELVLSLFTSVSDANRVGDVLRFSAICLPGFSIYLLLMSAFRALRDTRTTFEINVVENALNIVVGAGLYAWIGVRGLAAGFAVAYLSAAIVAFVVMRNRCAGLDDRRILSTLAKTVTASAAMAAVLTGLLWLAEQRLLPEPGDTGRWAPLAGVTAVLLLLGVTVYGIAARVLGLDDIAAVISTLQRRRSSRS